VIVNELQRDHQAGLECKLHNAPFNKRSVSREVGVERKFLPGCDDAGWDQTRHRLECALVEDAHAVVESNEVEVVQVDEMVAWGCGHGACEAKMWGRGFKFPEREALGARAEVVLADLLSQ
jgi:hypothetical protein